MEQYFESQGGGDALTGLRSFIAVQFVSQAMVVVERIARYSLRSAIKPKRPIFDWAERLSLLAMVWLYFATYMDQC